MFDGDLRRTLIAVHSRRDIKFGFASFYKDHLKLQAQLDLKLSPSGQNPKICD